MTATGHGCDANVTVVLTMADRQVGQTTAGADGTFTTPLDVGTFPVGRYAVLAQCGPLLTTSLDIVLASQVVEPTTTFVLIIFFLLVGLAIFRRRIRLDTAPTSSAIDDDTDEEPDATT
ncbi:MAG TPA: hypothetical protein VMU09_09085 [Acidimicrobiales bacterium]|nr:hypothetical protein [Acidimicrobiales bacterium]